jgi:hypothetical protein
MHKKPDRVTRLDEFSPNLGLFTLGSSLKITEMAHILVLLFPWLGFCITFNKNGLGSILDDFFTNSSGHTEARII